MGSQIPFTVFRLLKLPRFGPVKIKSLISKSGFVNSNGRTSQFDVQEIISFLSPLEKNLFEKEIEPAIQEWNLIEEKGIRVISCWDSEYPKRILRVCKDKVPPLLFVLGNLDIILKPSIGFCGSRKASQKGLETARDCSKQLVEDGFNIVSGYAAGVDLETHRTALECGGTTTIVLAEGILNFKIKKALDSVWDWSRVAVISEFLPKITWNVGNAMKRNSTICALSDAMILIEASKIGGSISAGRTCLDLGIPLFAPVYEGMPKEAEGNRELLKVGALPLMKKKSEGKANIKPILEALEQTGQSGKFTPTLGLF